MFKPHYVNFLAHKSPESRQLFKTTLYFIPEFYRMIALILNAFFKAFWAQSLMAQRDMVFMT